MAYINPGTNIYGGAKVGLPKIGKGVVDGTPNSVLFIDASGNLAQDNAGFTYTVGTGLNLDDNLETIGYIKSNSLIWSSGGTAGTKVSARFENYDDTLGVSAVAFAAKLSGSDWNPLHFGKEQAWNSASAATAKDAYIAFNVLKDGTGSEAMRIDSSGNVGIGTTAPDSTLEINAVAGGVMRLTYNDANGSATDYSTLGVGASGLTTLTTVDSDGALGHIALMPDGNVGIGTDSPASKLTVYNGNIEAISPSSAISIGVTRYGGHSFAPLFLSKKGRGSDTAPTGVLTGDGLLRHAVQGILDTGTFSTLSNFSDLIRVVATQDWTSTAQGRNLSFLVIPNNSAIAQEALSIQNDGNVGIGTTGPTDLLHIVGSDASNPITLEVQNLEGTDADSELLLSTSSNISAKTIGVSLLADRTNVGGAGSTDLLFRNSLATSLNTNMIIKASGSVGIGTTDPSVKLHVDDAIAISNDTEGSTARITIQSTSEVVTLTGATTDTTINIPSGAILLGASFNVDTAVVDSAGDDTWSAAYVTGSTTALATGAAATLNTKVNTTIVPEKASAQTNIRFTPNAGNFSSGAVQVVAYYWALTGLANA